MSIKIAGTYMDRSLNEFTRACEVYIEAEQAKLAPDKALIALLCDAVRLTREMTLRGGALCATRCQCGGPPRPTDRREGLDKEVPEYAEDHIPDRRRGHRDPMKNTAKDQWGAKRLRSMSGEDAIRNPGSSLCLPPLPTLDLPSLPRP